MTDVVYASRLGRLPVIDRDDTTLGRVDDIVIGPPAGHPPSLLGLVVAVPGRRIFVSVGRVASVEPDGVHLTTTQLNMRRFARRPSEVLVFHDLLDRHIEALDANVNDIALIPSPTRDGMWEVSSVDLRARAKGLRVGRRSRWNVGWTEVPGIFPAADREHGDLRDMRARDIAQQVQQMAPEHRTDAVRHLDDELLADLLEELDEDIGTALIDELDLERAADVLEAMEPDDAADLLGELRGGRQGELLEAMEPHEAAPLRRLLQYGDHTAGGLMTPEPIILTPTTTVAEALARLREPEITPSMAAQAFVADAPVETPTGTFRGMVHIQRLLREPPSTPVGRLVDTDIAPLDPDTDELAVATRLAGYNLLALPVCDRQGRLLGAVTIDDVLDRVLPEGWRS